MYIVVVAPLKRTMRKETLTYYAAKAPAAGTLVYAPVRKKDTLALVLESTPAKQAKGDLKASDFQLKKLSSIVGPSDFSPAFFAAAHEIATYFVTSIGATIESIIPHHILTHTPQEADTQEPDSETSQTNITQERLVLQAPREDRLSFYKTHIREAFAKEQSVFICLPTSAAIEQFAQALTRGIEQYVHIIDPTKTQKQQRAQYTKALQADHPILLLATPQYLFFPRQDVETVIVEHESSGAYKQQKTPYLDMRVVAELITAQTKQRLIFADTLLRVETIWRTEERAFSQVYPMNFRTVPQAAYTVIPMGTSDGTTYELLSPEVKELLTYITKERQRVFFYTLRKGLATSTVCKDCGTVLSCPQCDHPLVLHEEPNERRYFYCTQCRKRMTSHITCRHCESWNLLPLGIGTDRVIERINTFAPALPTFHVSKHTTTTKTQAKKKVTQFFETAPAVLVGTELALNYINKPVPYTAVISFDSLLSIPSYTINEQLIHLLMHLGEHTTEHVLIQTKDEHNPTIKALDRKNVSTFYHTEIERRGQLRYPPFVTLITVRMRGTHEQIQKARAYLAETFATYQPHLYESTRGKEHSCHMVLKVDHTNWHIDHIKGRAHIDADLAGLLKTLPDWWHINVAPKDLL